MKNIQQPEHRCSRIKSRESDEDVYLKIRSFNGKWVLHYFRFACDQCVYDEEAQYEGELMLAFDVLINFCPYCGLLLNKKFVQPKPPSSVTENSSTHHCETLKKYNQKYPHVGFSFDTDAKWVIAKNMDHWFIERHSVATDRMVKANEADKNELVFWGGIGISFCPFCGQSLEDSVAKGCGL